LRIADSPVFGRAILQVMLDKRKRAHDHASDLGVALPWSVYDALLEGEDSRSDLSGGRLRGTYWDPLYGQMSFQFCRSCNKLGPPVSESFLATFYLCNECVLK
jgi:hypothetical protein